MIRQLTWILPVILLAAGMSYLFIPKNQDLALVQFRSKEFYSAQATYLKEIEDGNDSVEVVRGLVELYIHYGEVDQAIELMRSYVKKHPSDISALQKLAKYYQYAQRYDDYIRTLEEIRELKPDVDVLRQLADLYNTLGRYQDQVTILQGIVNSAEAEPRDYLNLAQIGASLGQLNVAVETLQALYEDTKGDVELDAILLWVSLLAQTDQDKLAAQRALEWIVLKNNPDASAELAEALAFRSSQKVAYQFLIKAQERYPDNIAIEVQLAIAEAETGQKQSALARLKKVHAAGKLKENMLDMLVNLALDEKDYDTAFEISQTADPFLFARGTLVYVVETAVETGSVKVAQNIVHGRGEQFLEIAPVLGARLSLILGDRESAMKWAMVALEREGLPLERRMALLQLLMDLERNDLARVYLVETLDREGDDVPDWVLSQVASLYWILDEIDPGRRYFQRLIDNGRETPPAYAGWAVLSAAAGREKEVLAWYEKQDPQQMQPYALQDLYFAAVDGKADKLSLAVAEDRFMIQADSVRRRLLADALIRTGQAKQALPFLRELVQQPELEERTALIATYVTALRAAYAEGAPLRGELIDASLLGLREAKGTDEYPTHVQGLVDAEAFRQALPWMDRLVQSEGIDWLTAYVDTALKANKPRAGLRALSRTLTTSNIDDKTRENLTYYLIEVGGNGPALPFIEKLARTQGGNWEFTYQEALKEVKGLEALLDYLEMRGSKPDISIEERRNIAFLLLDAGRKDRAIRVVKILADGAGPESDDLNQLIYLWGPRPTPEAVNWLSDQAMTTYQGRGQLAKWVEILTNARTPDIAIQLAKLEPVTGELDDLARATIRALRSLKDRNKLKEYVGFHLDYATKISDVLFLATVGFEEGFTDIARSGFERILTVRPQHVEALRGAGQTAFFAGEFTAAQDRLLQYVSLVGDKADYNSLFQLGEIARNWQENDTAEDYYEKSLAAIDKIGRPDSSVKIIQALVKHRLGNDSQARDEFESLMAKGTIRKEVIPYYAQFLLDKNELQPAQRTLWPTG